jgi:hypothetical protein
MAAKAKKATSWTETNGRHEANAEHLAAVETLEPKSEATIVLPKLDIRHVEITLVGDSPLIVNRWSEKARDQMLNKQMGKATAGREKKDPWQCFTDSLYWLTPKPVKPTQEDVESAKFGFPTIAFKNCAVDACTSLGRGNITKVAARQSFHVIGELAEIVGPTPKMREDMVRLAGPSASADIRFRGEFFPWTITLKVRFNSRVLSAEQLFNLFSTAGFAVGIGEWRSERGGAMGLFHIGNEGDVGPANV